MVDVRSYEIVVVSHQILDNAMRQDSAVVSSVANWALKKGYGIYQLPSVTHTRRDASTISKVLSDLDLYRAAGYSITAVIELENEYHNADRTWWKHFRSALLQRGWEKLPIVLVPESETLGSEFDPGIRLS